MDIFKKELGDKVNEAYKIIAEYEAWVGFQKIKIKIKVDLNGKYSYELSHHYHGSKQAGAYISSINSFDNEQQALAGARKEMFSFYDPDDKNAVWEKSEDF